MDAHCNVPRHTLAQIFPYMLYWIVTLGLLHYNNIVNGLTHRKVVGKLATFAKLACSFAFLWGFLQFVWSCSVDWHPWVGFVSSILAMGLFGVAFYAQTILSGSDYARRATLALVYLGGAVFWHVFMLVVMAVQIDDLSKCLDASDVLAGFAKAYKGHEEDMLQDKDYLAVTQSLARLEDLDGVAVTLDGEICGARRFGNSFAHQLFIFNTDHIRGTRHEGYWNGGATIIMAFLINMFSGAFHIGYAYHLWRFYSQIAQGVVEPLGTETKTLPTTKEDVSEQLY